VKRLLLLAALCGTAAASVGAEPPAGDDPWLSRLVGHWVLEGRMAGKDTTHDIDAEWVLNHLYVRLHEVSRAYDLATRTWAWAMDNVDKGVPKPFGRVKLSRR